MLESEKVIYLVIWEHQAAEAADAHEKQHHKKQEQNSQVPSAALPERGIPKYQVIKSAASLERRCCSHSPKGDLEYWDLPGMDLQTSIVGCWRIAACAVSLLRLGDTERVTASYKTVIRAAETEQRMPLPSWTFASLVQGDTQVPDLADRDEQRI